MEKKNYVQHSEDKEIDEFARLAIVRACGDPQNLMQPDAFEDLFDGEASQNLRLAMM